MQRICQRFNSQLSMVKNMHIIILFILCFAPFLGFRFDLITIGYYFVVILLFKNHFFTKRRNDITPIFLNFYFIWLLICFLRGIVICENYFDWKNIALNTLYLLCPMFIYIALNPTFLSKFFRLYFRFWVIPLFIYFIFIGNKSALHFNFAFCIVLGCFLPLIPKNWRFLILIVLFTMIISDFTARAQIIKAFFSLTISLLVIFRKYIKKWMLCSIIGICLTSPFYFIYQGFFGTFNIFEHFEKENSKNEFISKEDTRTFIYQEVITSAIKNNYVMCGRTPARGNDSKFMGKYDLSGRGQRNANEVNHANIFTWTGIIGLLLWGTLYFYAIYLCIRKSNNIYMQIWALFIAFRFALGWIEEMSTFSQQGMSIWITIGMGYSPFLRSLNDNEFEFWIKSIFYRNTLQCKTLSI